MISMPQDLRNFVKKIFSLFVPLDILLHYPVIDNSIGLKKTFSGSLIKFSDENL